MKNFKIYLLAGVLFLGACKPEIHNPAPSKGSADFSRFIAVGNSLTAGYSNGGLYLDGQLNSYPAIMAKEMQTVGGGAFNQPLFSAGQENGSGYLSLTGFDASGNPVTAPVTTDLAVRGQIAVRLAMLFYIPNIPAILRTTVYRVLNSSKSLTPLMVTLTAILNVCCRVTRQPIRLII